MYAFIFNTYYSISCFSVRVLRELDGAARSWEDQGGQSEKCPESIAKDQQQQHFKMVLVFIPQMFPELTTQLVVITLPQKLDTTAMKPNPLYIIYSSWFVFTV